MDAVVFVAVVVAAVANVVIIDAAVVAVGVDETSLSSPFFITIKNFSPAKGGEKVSFVEKLNQLSRCRPFLGAPTFVRKGHSSFSRA